VALRPPGEDGVTAATVFARRGWGWYRNGRWQAQPRPGAWHPEQHFETGRAQV